MQDGSTYYYTYDALGQQVREDRSDLKKPICIPMTRVE